MKKVKAIAILAGLVAAVLIFVLLNSVIKFGGTETMSVVTAASTISANTIITEDMLTLSDVPSDAVLPGAVTSISAAVGKTIKADLYTGEQIISEKLISPGETDNATLAYALEAGMRAITIPVDPTTGLAGMIHPGDTIDLIGDFDYDGKVVTDLVGENIKVLAVDNNRTGGAIIGDGTIQAYTTLTLEVTPSMAMQVSSASRNGSLRAVLRSPLDIELLQYKSITISEVLNLK